MNGWFLAAGALLAAAFSVHLFSGNRLYSAARPDAATAPPRACEAWMMGRCGMQMISVDLLLAAGFLVLSGLGVLPRSFWFELFLLLLFGGWGIFWLVSLACEKAGGRYFLRLCQWVLFLVLFGLVLGGMLGQPYCSSS